MQVLLPSRLDEALAMLAERPDAIPVAGGTDVMVHWPARPEAQDKTYLDLSALEAELRPIRWEDGDLVLGALTTYWDLIRDPRAGEAFPLLVRAARQVGAIQIQARGTWAGNIANASPAADGVPALMAYDSDLVLDSTQGGRETVPLSEFYLGYKTMKRRPEQLIREIRIPLNRFASGQGPRRDYDVLVFEKVGSRRAQAITKVGLALTHSNEGWRVVANSMAPTVCRCRAVEALLEAGAHIAKPEDLLPAIRRDLKPIDDIRSTAVYRERVFARVLFHHVAG